MLVWHFVIGTFTILQVFNLVCDFHDRALCVMTVVMTCRKYPLYKKVLKKVRELFPDYVPQQVMCDYEASMRKAFAVVYPQSRMLGCR